LNTAGRFPPVRRFSLAFSTIVENSLQPISRAPFSDMKPIELTEAEWVIIKTVWDHEPCAAPTVQELLEKEKSWAYSTVRTLMDRMVAKGLLKSEKVRHLTLYRAAVSRGQAQKGELLYTLKNAFNGALTPMLQCLLEDQKLTGKELDELEELIAEKRRKPGKK
jgi:BlaI family penicillinase repressor